MTTNPPPAYYPVDSYTATDWRNHTVRISDEVAGLEIAVDFYEDDIIGRRLTGLHLHPTTEVGADTITNLLPTLGLALLPARVGPAIAATPPAEPTPRAAPEAPVSSTDASEPPDPGGATDPAPAAPPETPPGPPETIPAAQFTPPAPRKATNNGAKRGYYKRPADAELKAAFKDLGGAPNAAQIGEHFQVPAEAAGRWIRNARARGINLGSRK